MKTRWQIAVVLILLLVAGLKWLSNDMVNTSDFLLAAYNGQTDVVAKMLKAGEKPDITDAKYGATALIYASQQGNTDIVKLLLDHHADINVVDKKRQIALGQAAYNGHVDIVKLLLQRGAKLDDWHRPSVLKALATHPEIINMLPPLETPMAEPVKTPETPPQGKAP